MTFQTGQCSGHPMGRLHLPTGVQRGYCSPAHSYINEDSHSVFRESETILL